MGSCATSATVVSAPMAPPSSQRVGEERGCRASGRCGQLGHGPLPVPGGGKSTTDRGGDPCRSLSDARRTRCPGRRAASDRPRPRPTVNGARKLSASTSSTLDPTTRTAPAGGSRSLTTTVSPASTTTSDVRVGAVEHEGARAGRAARVALSAGPRAATYRRLARTSSASTTGAKPSGSTMSRSWIHASQRACSGEGVQADVAGRRLGEDATTGPRRGRPAGRPAPRRRRGSARAPSRERGPACRRPSAPG